MCHKTHSLVLDDYESFLTIGSEGTARAGRMQSEWGEPQRTPRGERGEMEWRRVARLAANSGGAGIMSFRGSPPEAGGEKSLTAKRSSSITDSVVAKRKGFLTLPAGRQVRNDTLATTRRV